MNATTTPGQSPHIPGIAQSLFGLLALAFVFALVSWVAMLLSPPSPDATFERWRGLILAGAGLILAINLGFCVWAFRQPVAELETLAQRIDAILGRPWLALFIVFIIIEMNLVAAFALQDVAPALVQPARLWLVGGSLAKLLLLFVVHRVRLNNWLKATRDGWAGIGLGLFSLIVLMGLAFITVRLVQISGINDSLRGGLDYRPLIFVDDGEAPAPATFWDEQARLRVRWLPYSYWTVTPQTGRYVNVSAEGLRHTPTYDAQPDARRLAIFGGSTVWGEGARDAYTIPGHLAHLLAEAGTPAHVMNFGQTGYVSTQDAILFQLQLVREDRPKPDYVIFYQGFNDVLSAYSEGFTGVSLQEAQRLADAETGRLLRAGQPVLRQAQPGLEAAALMLAGARPATAEAITQRWFANVTLLRTIATGYNIEVLFVWQPALFLKETLTDTEQVILIQEEARRPGLANLYREVDALVRARLALEPADDILYLGDLFTVDERPVFFDFVHISEIGNGAVAEAILPHLSEWLPTNGD